MTRPRLILLRLLVLAVDQQAASVVVRTDQGDRRSARVPLDQFRRGTRRAKVLALGVPR